MKKSIYIFASLITILTTLSACNGGSDNEPFATADFSFSAKDANNITFTAQTTGNYELLEWVFPNNTSINHQNPVDYYFPKKGTYSVTLNLWQKGEKVSATKEITIETDDPGYGMKLVWSDEFDGTALNTQNWTLETGYIANNELQDYQSSGNHEISGGTLKITARKVNDNKQFGSYTSARMITGGKKEFTYGRVEARARLPKGRGTWPAIWMLGGSILKGTPWPACGEIDIMEYVGYNPGWIKGSTHCASYFGSNSQGGDKAISKEDEWHIYGINWDSEKIEFYLDDPANVYFTYNPSPKTAGNYPFTEPHFLILNLAIGGDWGGAQGIDNTIFPVTMEVDYVRVYQEK